MTENALASYVKENPEPTDENIRAFAEQYKERGINEEILLLLIRNEYLSKMPYEDRPIADPIFDRQLRRAIEFIRSGS
jgi:carboxyl-terminal processing protease